VQQEESRLQILTAKERIYVRNNEPEGFIQAFEEWAALKTDAPAYSLTAAALQALSLAAGDQVTLPGIFSDSPAFLNLFILVVGPSTTMRKTTVLNYIRSLLPKNQQTHADYIFFLDDVSTQAFNKAAAEAGKAKAPLLFSVDEVSGLFGEVRRKNSYLQNFDKTLCRVYDHSPIMIHRTNSKLEVESGAFISIFAASTPDPLMEVLNSDNVESGLLPRFLIFDVRDAERGERHSLMDRRKNDESWLEQKEVLKEFLYQIAKYRANGMQDGTDVYGYATFQTTTIEINDQALQRLDAIDNQFSSEVGKDSTSWGAIKGRAFWHIFKLSGLYALSRAGLDAVLEIDDVLHAAALVEDTVSDLARMQEEVGANPHERKVNAALAMLDGAANKRLPQSTITRRLVLSGREASDLLGTLYARDQVVVEKNPQGKPYWIRKL